MQVKKNNMSINYIKHLIFACLITVILLLFSAFLVCKTDLSAKGLSVLLVVTYILSNLLAGWLIGKSVEKRQFIWGLLVGLGYFMIVLLVSFVGNQFFLNDVSKLILVFFLCVCSGMFGGMLS